MVSSWGLTPFPVYMKDIVCYLVSKTGLGLLPPNICCGKKVYVNIFNKYLGPT